MPKLCDTAHLNTADMLTEGNEKFVEFGIGGLCNCSLGKFKTNLR